MKRRLLALVLSVCAVGLLHTSVARAEIVGTTGAIVEIGPPASLMQDELASLTEAFAFDELQNVTLTAPLPVDITEPGTYDETSDLTAGSLAAGTVVDSHMIHSDHPDDAPGNTRVEGTVVVDNDIVGIQVLGPTLDTGDGPLGLPGTIYPTGFTQRQIAIDPDRDFLILQVDKRTVFFHIETNAHVDEVRIITKASKAVPAVTSQVHNSSHADITGQTVPAGTMVHDKAIVTGSGPIPTGTVDFARFTNSACSGSPVAIESDVVLGADGTAESSTFTVVGAMAYRVHYDGDANYEPGDGPCEPLLVGKRTPNVKTEVHDKYSHKDITGEVVSPGKWIHDKAFVTGSGPTPTGTVDFVRYATANCTGYPVSTQSNVPLSGGTAESANVSVWGDTSYKVHYDGDANYAPADGPCEPLYVEKTGCEGCTAYYWKSHTSKWTGVSTSTSFEAVFGRDVFAGDPTMLEVLNYSGGGMKGLARESAAAYLNARHPDVDFFLKSDDVVYGFQVIADHGGYWSIEIAKAVLAALNSSNCPLKW
jgi:hypothetical protein